MMINTKGVKKLNKKHFVSYLRRWLGLSLLVASNNVIAGPGDPAAEPSVGCSVPNPFIMSGPAWITTLSGPIIDSTGVSSTAFTMLGVGTNDASYGSLFVDSLGGNGYQFISLSLTAPNAGFIQPALGSPTTPSEPIPQDATTTVYHTIGGDLNNNVCTYSFDITNTGGVNVASNPQIYQRQALPVLPNNPTAVPIFTPIGIVATIVGLLWFGRRRSIKLKS